MPDIKVNFEHLRTAVDWSVRQLGRPRSNRIDALRQYVGSHYSDNGSDKRVPTNFLELAVTIYSYQLASKSPMALVTTDSRDMRPFAKRMEIALNQVPDEISLGATLQEAVIEALFAFGVVKVGLAATGTEVLGHDVGEPFVDLIGLDDYFLDMSAKRRKSVEFEGNDYWLPIEDARKMYEAYGEGPPSDVEPDEHTVTGDQGEERADGIGADEGADVYRDKVQMRDVWIVRENKLVTYGIKSSKVFNIVDWDGPEHSPYHTLGYSVVPGNILPLPPVSLWIDLHELGNSLFRKLGRQADAKKTIAAFQGGNNEDIEALKKAADGEGIAYHGQKPENISVGGIDGPTLAFFLQCRDLFSYLGGNLDTLGGLAPQTDTVGQDKLLSEAASARLTHMRGKTNDFVSGIFKAIAWYEWTDPVRERVVYKSVEGSDIKIRGTWKPGVREGNFLDYNTEIDVYSMQDQSPSSRLQKIGTALERFVYPILPQLQQQGGQIDFKKLIELIARLGNVSELEEVVYFQDPYDVVPVEAEGEQPALSGSKPANTTRTYERVNRPGATRHGKDDVLTRALLGIGVQDSEMDAVSRPTG